MYINRCVKWGGAQLAEAGAAIVGGHSIENKEPIFGMSADRTSESQLYLEKQRGPSRDVLILTKRIGTGIMNNALKAVLFL